VQAERILLIGAIALLPLPVWVSRFPPLQDYTLHLARVSIEAHYHDPGVEYPRYFTLARWPVPYALADYLWRLLACGMSLDTAGKLLLSFSLWGLAASLVYFRLQVAGPPAAPVLLVLPLFYHHAFHMGYVPFITSLPFLYLAVGYWWAHRARGSLPQLVSLAVLALLAYLGHLYAFLVLAGSLLLLASLERERFHALLLSAGSLIPTLVLASISYLQHDELPCKTWLAWYGGSRHLRRWDQSLVDSGWPGLALLFRRALMVVEQFVSFSLRWDLMILAGVLVLTLALPYRGWKNAG